MKRYKAKNMADRELIRLAIINASKNKRNRTNVKRVLEDIESHITIIQNMVVNETYIPTPYRVFEILDGISGKKRIVSCPAFFPDQVLHWVVILATQNILSRGMYEFTCGSVPKRGIHYGQKYIKRWIETDRKNTKYCAKMDVSKFYPSISHEALRTALKKRIKDKKALWLFGVIIDSTEKGLPIGNYTSQWLANYLLQDLDHYIKQDLKIVHYMRYMDDIVLFGANKKKLRKAVYAISDYISPLGLKLKSNYQVFRFDYIDRKGSRRGRDLDFMGFRFFRDKTIIRKKISLRMKRLANRISKSNNITYKQAAAMMSYLGWIKYTDSHYFYTKHIKSKIDTKKLKEIIRNENRKRNKTAELFSGTIGERQGQNNTMGE